MRNYRVIRSISYEEIPHPLSYREDIWCIDRGYYEEVGFRFSIH